jgi:hypothetical protein
MRGNASSVMRLPEMRGKLLIKLVWCWWAPSLTDHTPMTISVKGTAESLGVKPDNVRKVLRELEALGFLKVAVPATRGTAAEYVLGPRGYASQYRLHPLLRAQQIAAMETPPNQRAA